MMNLIGLAVVLFIFAAVVGCMVYLSSFEKATGLPTRRPFYYLFGLVLAAAIVLFILYEAGVIDLGMS